MKYGKASFFIVRSEFSWKMRIELHVLDRGGGGRRKILLVESSVRQPIVSGQFISLNFVDDFRNDPIWIRNLKFISFGKMKTNKQIDSEKKKEESFKIWKRSFVSSSSHLHFVSRFDKQISSFRRFYAHSQLGRTFAQSHNSLPVKFFH